MKTDLPQYSAFESTDSEWLGKLPKGWKAIRLSRLNNKLTNGFVGPTRDILREDGVRYLQSLHIKGGRILFNTPYYVSEEWSNEHSKSILKEGDVLIVQTGDIGQVAAVTKEFSGCNCHALIIVSTKDKLIDGFFLSAVLRSHYGLNSLKSVQTGALHPHLNCTIIRDIFIPVPPLEEQQTILGFLNRETSKIDRLATVRREQIERLHEQRSALVHKAVTKGINSTAHTKPSHIEWIGDIPDRWGVRRLKMASKRILTGATPDDSLFEYEGPIPWHAPGDFSNGIQLSTSKKTLRADAFSSGVRKFPAGSVLIVGIGATLGKVAYTEADCSGNQQLNCVIPSEVVLGKFLAITLNTFSEVMKMLSNSSTLGILNQTKTGEIYLPIPPIEEQRQILAYIKNETDRIDNLIAKYNRELELLEEYRASLISHAVTGKIDVRSLLETSQPALAGAL